MEDTASRSNLATEGADPSAGSEESPATSSAGVVASAPLIDRIEIEKMREMLREQQRAAGRAMTTISDLQTKFSLAQAQFERIGRSYQDIPARTGPVVPPITLPLPRPEFPEIPVEPAAPQRNIARMIVGVSAIIAAAVGWGVVVWLLFVVRGATVPDPPVFTPATIAEMDDEEAAKDPNAAFKKSLAALDAALAEYPGKLPADLLWEASQKDGSCQLQWNDGYPSFLFGSGKPHPKPLTREIAECADAVRRLHGGRGINSP